MVNCGCLSYRSCHLNRGKTNNRGENAVLVSEDDWLAIQETLYLNSIPGMTQSILDSRAEDVSEYTSYNPEEEW